MELKTNPVYGFFRTIFLYLAGRVYFIKEDVGKNIKMEDGKVYRIFRRVIIKHFSKKSKKPEGLFIIRFTPENMTVEENIKYSRKPMLVFQGFYGFRSKYWAVDYDTGECQGIYEWDTYEDALRYSKSIAVRVMTNRSKKDSIKFWILENTEKNRRFSIENNNELSIK